MQATAWAMDRSAARVHLDLKKRLGHLATIASIGPFLGLFGTILGVCATFGAVDGSPSTIFFYYVEGLSEALIPTTLGLLVAVPAYWGYNRLSNRAEAFNAEMKNVSLDVLNKLSRLRQPTT